MNDVKDGIQFRVVDTILDGSLVTRETEARQVKSVLGRVTPTTPWHRLGDKMPEPLNSMVIEFLKQ